MTKPSKINVLITKNIIDRMIYEAIDYAVHEIPDHGRGAKQIWKKLAPYERDAYVEVQKAVSGGTLTPHDWDHAEEVL